MTDPGVFGLSKLCLSMMMESKFIMRIGNCSTPDRFRNRWKREPGEATMSMRRHYRSSVKLAILLFGFVLGPPIAGVAAQQAEARC